MKKNVKLISAIGVAVVIVALILTGILKTAGTIDVVGKGSVDSFEAVLSASDSGVVFDEENKGWKLEAPDGSAGFIWSGNFSESPLFDVMLSVDAAPFVEAGLDIEKLPEYYTVQDGMLLVGTQLGEDQGKEEATPKAAYEEIVRKYPHQIGYHTPMDHYNISLGNGNLFEWAKNMEMNGSVKEAQDKDIVFVLHPEPLIAAGVDPEKVEGWAYTTVSMGMGASAEEMYKFLKPFDLQ